MFKAEIININKASGGASATVKFSQGSEVFTKEYSFNSEMTNHELGVRISDDANKFENTYLVAETIKLGEIALSKKNEGVDEYKELIAKHNRFLRAIEIGATDENDSNFIALNTELKSKFKPEYISLF